MGGKSTMAALFVILAANLLQSTYGRTYTVGDSTGWGIPANNNDDFYDDWADNKDFLVGDVLVFNFTNGQHNVVEVTEAGYDACNAANPVSTVSTGPARITLNRTGEYYFICGIPGHCSAGQKLNVEVRNGNTTGGVTPSTPVTPTTTTYTVGDSTGWRVPTNNDDFYEDWADNKHFVVGDVLVFNFTTGQHNVAEVTEDAYDDCNTANAISTLTTGPARITLNKTGDHYFICSVPGHCSAGQKLKVEVRTGNTTGGVAPSPPVTPSTTTFTVGDSTGWRVPTNDDFYEDWADHKHFVVGDVLVFNFTTGQHNVAEVTEDGYDDCNAANAISTLTTGPARITLNKTGDNYFICSVPGHCSAGQKLKVEVRTGNTTGGVAPSPPVTPSTTTFTVGDSTGWRVPTNNDDFYEDWADHKDFVVGDVLVFNFTTGQHNVAEVTEDGYDDCNAANAISTLTTGPARITLNKTGDNYFICSVPGHCSAGQKLKVEVRTGNTTGGVAPSPPVTPSTTTFTVGDSTGWRVPTNNDDFYEDWADHKDFVVGDVLVFNFTTGQHNVAEVTEDGYDDCNAANAISTLTTGPARITLNRTGDHYFICSIPGHCSAGQKLKVEVRNGNRTSTSPTPGTPSAAAPGTSSSPGTNSASSHVATLSLVFFMSIAMTLFC
ncbi:hypothetical protein ES319_D13G235100v1 [Gossypium barbadense]|uniref:Phytocyanin domain-containing protein n=2 Tax=Gossypium TaxID=3633 RepID=A0A5J5NQ35_GOSBA|nr:hypothetical protein ES319_D13G235100v1 [Gossypium barbadense]TYG38739.1 hypothetical protein ES288_D13G248300v1 [Gossypium darwinii]